MPPGVIRGPSRKYGRVCASADSLELTEAKPFALAGSRFRLKTAPKNGSRVVDLGIIIAGSDRAKFVTGARLSRMSELLCYFQSHKAPVLVRPQRCVGSLPCHNRFVNCAQSKQRTPQPRSQATSDFASLIDANGANYILTPYERHEAEDNAER